MSSKSKQKDVVPVAGTARGGYTKLIRSASTPESKLKPTPDQKSTACQSQTPVKVPHYLRASTGSCHDFCKYGGRRTLEEEEEKSGSHSSKKKDGLRKGPKWKDIVSYDAVGKIQKPQVVPLVSSKVAVPAKPDFERPTESARRNLRRQASLDASCSSGSKGLHKPVKISSAPSKSKVGRPETIHKETVSISNRPKIQQRSAGKVNRRPSNIFRNCAEAYMGSSRATDGNGGEASMERTLYVVDPELEVEPVQVDFDSNKEKTTEVLKPDFKETTEVHFGIEGPKGTETVEVFKREDIVIGEAPEECLINEADKSIREINTPLPPDKETVVESDPELGEKSKNFESDKIIREINTPLPPDKETVVESEPELGQKSKNAESDKGTVVESEPELGEKSISFEPDKGTVVESEPELGEKSISFEPDKGTIVESEPELGEKSKNSEPNKGTVVETEPELVKKGKNFEPSNEAILKSGYISSESAEKFEPESESDFESSAEAEESMGSESESEGGSVSISRSTSSGSVKSASKNEKLKVERSNRRRTRSEQLEEKAYKLKFKPARVVELKPACESEPRRLKFRKPRVVGENHKSSGDGRKASYRKQSRSDLTEPNSVDQKSVGVVLRHQDGKERKEEPNGLFNNVIEETASKLVETRKSKVKALVGAFETVISLQDGKPTSTA